MGTTPNYNIQYPDSGDQWDLINDLQTLADTTDTAIDSILPVSIANGGTGATTKFNAQTNLGIKVRQIVTATYGTAVSTTSTGAWVSTGLSATITPLVASGKLLIFTSQDMQNTEIGKTGAVNLFYNSTFNIGSNTAGMVQMYSAQAGYIQNMSMTGTLAINSTAALTIESKMRVTFGSTTLTSQPNNSTGFIILMEVDA